MSLTAARIPAGCTMSMGGIQTRAAADTVSYTHLHGKVWESAGGDKKELSGKFVSDIGGKPRRSGQTKIYRIFESSAGAYGNRSGSFGCCLLYTSRCV